jgi:aminoglycoside phosphotransferase family enzyme/predicted kinase
VITRRRKSGALAPCDQGVEQAVTNDAQAEIIAFLSRPGTFGVRGAPVERIETHISMVWLAGGRAFKLKRAVRFDYVDFSTVALRRVACEAEVRLNRRTAPSLYLGVRAVTREADGSLALDGEGTPVDWLVEMARFEQDALFDRLAASGRLELALMGDLAAAIAQLHASARVRCDHGGRAGMAWVADGNTLGLAEQGGGTLDPEMCARLASDTQAAIVAQTARLDARRRGGLVRECHGDLHLRNICLLDGVPTLFDGVEFNDDISCIDVLYDLAFLLMDLWRRQLRAHANAVFNEYLACTADVDALCLMPLFLSCRAAVRAKTSVTAAGSQTGADRRVELDAAAKEYLELAQHFLHPPAPRLIAVGGFSGSGKSTLARGLAADIGPAPGALVLRSDVMRKSLLRVPPLTRLGPDGYSSHVTREVYRLMRERAKGALEAGQAVIADAVFADPAERQALEAMAHEIEVPFSGLWLDAPATVMARRISDRPLDASDATPAVLDRQLSGGLPPIEWPHIDGSADIETVRERAKAMVS